jgi:hypothetical protein
VCASSGGPQRAGSGDEEAKAEESVQHDHSRSSPGARCPRAWSGPRHRPRGPSIRTGTGEARGDKSQRLGRPEEGTTCGPALGECGGQIRRFRAPGGGERGARPRGRRTGAGTCLGDGPKPSLSTRGARLRPGCRTRTSAARLGRAATAGRRAWRAGAAGDGGRGGMKAPSVATAAKCSRRRVDLEELFLGFLCCLNRLN